MSKVYQNKIFLVIEKGWSSGELVLWACSQLYDAEHLVNLRKELRYIQTIELRP